MKKNVFVRGKWGLVGWAGFVLVKFMMRKRICGEITLKNILKYVLFLVEEPKKINWNISGK